MVVEPTGSETQVFAKLGGEDVVAVFRERHQVRAGRQDPAQARPGAGALFDEATGARLNAWRARPRRVTC